MGRFRQRLIDSFVIAVVFVAVIWIALMSLGKLYDLVLALYSGISRKRVD